MEDTIYVIESFNSSKHSPMADNYYDVIGFVTEEGLAMEIVENGGKDPVSGCSLLRYTEVEEYDLEGGQ